MIIGVAAKDSIRMPHYAKVVESPHYLLWTDALHARALARGANNQWDRGTYVRWCVITSWAVLEIACQDATNNSRIGYSFKDDLNSAIEKLGLGPLDWGKGIWQDVRMQQEKRKGYVHRFLSEKEFFPAANAADDAIQTVRKAVVAIYEHVKRPVPPWTADDEDRGWYVRETARGTLTVVQAGANEEDDQTLYIRSVVHGQERTSNVLPAGTQWQPYCDDLIQRAQSPIERVRVYRGQELIHDQGTKMRGA